MYLWRITILNFRFAKIAQQFKKCNFSLSIVWSFCMTLKKLHSYKRTRISRLVPLKKFILDFFLNETYFKFYVILGGLKMQITKSENHIWQPWHLIDLWCNFAKNPRFFSSLWYRQWRWHREWSHKRFGFLEIYHLHDLAYRQFTQIQSQTLVQKSI